MAFPALAGELLPERTRGQAAALLSLRHVGITLALAVLAPIVAAELDDQVQLARERGTALVLDAALPPTDKIELAPRLFANLETEDPRDALAQALARERRRVTTGDRDLLSRLQRLDRQLGGGGELLGRLEQLEDQYGSTLDEAARGLDRLLGTDRAEGLLDDLREDAGAESTPQQLGRELDKLGADLDDVVLAAVDAAFSPAFVLTGAMALLATLLLLFRLRGDGRPARGPPPAVLIGGAAALVLAVTAGYAVAESSLKTEPVDIADPCEARERHSVGGIEGVVEGIALRGLDRAACRFGSSREELVLALFDDQSRREYERTARCGPARAGRAAQGRARALALAGRHDDQLGDVHARGCRNGERDGGGDVARLDRPDLAHQLLQHRAPRVVAHVVAELRGDEPRLHGLDAHPARSELCAQVAREVRDGRLGRAVDPVVGEHGVAADRPDVNEVRGPALRSRRDQVGREGPPGREQPAHVGVEHAVPLAHVGLLERRGEHHTRVGHDQVDPAEALAHGDGGALDRLPVGHVGAHRDRAPVPSWPASSRRRSSRRPTSATAAPSAASPSRGGCADAAGGAGDYGHAAGEGKGVSVGVLGCRCHATHLGRRALA